ncbi:MAG TPA: ATP-binding cassette domain-containing protein [Deferrisomatales bacterium]|nr:ATP-binding cassette domain-containing protein [Deferrisomatales bacterium]
MKIEKRLSSHGPEFRLRASFASQDEFVVLFGPSGSGKTLTLQAISGLMRPDAGKIVVDGRVLFDARKRVDIPARRRDVGYLFQDYALFPHLSVAQNIACGLRRPWWGWGALPASGHKRVGELLEVFGLRAMAESRPRELSGGQRQRVALARALACQPKLLLLDEPFAALDQPMRARMRDNLKAVHAHFRIPAVLISHDPDDVEALADTLVMYEGGEVRKIWPVRSICQRRKVAQFVRSQFGAVLQPLGQAGEALR